METRIHKSKIEGWTAKSEIQLSGNRVLTITTRKWNSGLIVSFATVAEKHGSMLFHSVHKDFAKYVAQSDKRATEKAISELHHSVDFDAVINAAISHYS